MLPPVHASTAASAVAFSPLVTILSCRKGASCAVLASARRSMPLKKTMSWLQLESFSQAVSVRIWVVLEKKWLRVLLVRPSRRVCQVACAVPVVLGGRLV